MIQEHDLEKQTIDYIENNISYIPEQLWKNEILAQLKKMREEQVESEKCTQRTIRQLQQQLDDCVKQIRTLRTEMQNMNNKLRKSHM